MPYLQASGGSSGSVEVDSITVTAAITAGFGGGAGGGGQYGDAVIYIDQGRWEAVVNEAKPDRDRLCGPGQT